jgi:CRP/FNR family transcriptional regulator, cyclic AMP receptor protein
MVHEATGSALRLVGRDAPLGWDPGARAHVLARGDVLYRTGDPAAVAFAVEAGLLKLVIASPTGRERIVGVVGPGDVLGALTPLATAYAETAEAVSVTVSVRALDDRRPDHSTVVADAAGVHMARLQHVLEDVDLPVAARLARALVRLGERFGQRSEDGTVRLTLPLTHEHLAAMIGAARETTTLTLSELRQRGLVEGTRGRYRFDPARLLDAAHGPLLN